MGPHLCGVLPTLPPSHLTSTRKCALSSLCLEVTLPPQPANVTKEVRQGVWVCANRENEHQETQFESVLLFYFRDGKLDTPRRSGSGSRGA